MEAQEYLKYITIFDPKFITFIATGFFYIRNFGLDPDSINMDPED
jgi:hypothetical protein